jgi:hypothetical protein
LFLGELIFEGEFEGSFVGKYFDYSDDKNEEWSLNF